MKKFITTFLLLAGISFYSQAQYVSISDPGFRNYLATTFPSCMSGGLFDTGCVTGWTNVNCENYGIQNLNDIKYFHNLRSLNCSFNALTTLPPLHPLLTQLYCDDNQLTSLPPLPNTLTDLFCSSNQLTSLPTLPTSLRDLWVSDNLLDSLPQLPDSLSRLICGNNPLGSLPLLPDSLTDLSCYANQLTNLPALPDKLIQLSCSDNLLFGLPTLPAGLRSFGCDGNYLTVLPAFPNKLVYLDCSFNQLTSLPEFPDTMHTCHIDGNPITCLPEIKVILSYLNFNNTLISCVSNYGNVNNSTPDLDTIQLCQPGNPNGCVFDSTQVVANAGSDTSICSGGSITIGGNPTVSWGTPPYTYSWSPSTGISCVNCANPVASPLVTTTYCVSVTDNLGSSATACVTVTVNPRPTADAGPDDIMVDCPGAFDVLGGSPTASGGSGSYSYSWSPVTGLNSSTIPNPIVTGSLGVGNHTYCVTVTDIANGCTAGDCKVVTVNASTLIASVGNDVSTCAGTFVNVTLGGFPTGVGGTPPYLYSWSSTPAGFTSNVANPVASPTVTTTYCVTVTDSDSCTATACLTVTVNPSPVADAGSDTAVCIGSCLILGGTTTGSGGTGALAYMWAPGTGLNNSTIANPLACPGITTTFCVTVTDALGCSDTDCVAVTVNPNPVADAGADDIYCSNSGLCINIGGSPTASGGSAPYIYEWAPGVISPISNPCVNPTVTTTYPVTVTDDNGCTATDGVTVFVNSPPVVSFTGLNPSTCTNSGVFTLVGSPPGGIFWGPGVTGATFNPQIAGPGNHNISYMFTDGITGCSDTAVEIVPVNVAPVIDSISTTNISCFGGSDGSACVYPSGGAPPYLYHWGFANDTTQCLSGLSHNYGITVVDANGCTAAATAIITQPPAINLSIINTGDGILPDTLSATASGGCSPPYAYLWSNGDGIIYTNGTYDVIVTDNCACTASSSITIGSSSITVTYPNGGETFTTGQNLNVLWTSTGNIPKVKIEFYSSIAFNWITLVDSVANTGSYLFTIPAVPNMQGSIRISDPYNATVNDQSDSLFNIVNCLGACVWPGDADNNGLADNNDLLPIGLGYGTIGTVRAQQDINWYGHNSQDWVDTLLSGTNYKHIDCNGDGTINALDTFAILQNFGQTHAKTDETGGWRMTDPTLYVELIPDTTLAGDTLYATITLADSIIPASNVYGLAFTLNYDANVVDSTKTTVTFGNSWLGNATDKISIAKSFHPTGQLKCALTRIDHTNRSGFGQIGQAQFVITTDNINGKDLSYYTNHVWLSDITMIDNLGNIIAVNAGRDSSQVEFEVTGISSIRNPQSAIRIAPNPAEDEVLITVSENLIGGKLKLLDVEGRTLIETTIEIRNPKFEIRNLSQGIYFLHVTTRNGTLTKRLIIAR